MILSSCFKHCVLLSCHKGNSHNPLGTSCLGIIPKMHSFIVAMIQYRVSQKYSSCILTKLIFGYYSHLYLWWNIKYYYCCYGKCLSIATHHILDDTCLSNVVITWIFVRQDYPFLLKLLLFWVMLLSKILVA